MSVRIFLFSILCLVLLHKVEAQNFGVDPLTGRAIVNIPLGGISAQDISIPVSLNHHGGALQVDEGPGNAGMGWNVNIGGSIYREVRGLPDEINTATQKGWFYNSNASKVQGFNPSADDNLSVCTDETTDWNFVNSFGAINDPEPDVYYFNAPGISGKFIYGADGLPKLIPYQDLAITGGPIAGTNFTIKTNNGMVYYFGYGEVTTRQAVKSGLYQYNPVPYFNAAYNYYQNSVTFISSWQLSQLQSTSSGVIAYFTYQSLGEALNIKHVMGIAPSYTNKADTLYHINDLTGTIGLSQVTLKSYSINLTWANDLIDRIEIKESETGDSKGFDFKYQSVQGQYLTKEGLLPSENGLSQTLIKPFLMEVKQLRSCLAFPSYKFTYHGVTQSSFDIKTITVPWKQGWGKDFFGYYNGDMSSNRDIPTIYFYQSESGARRFRISPIPGMTETQKLTGTNREVVSSPVPNLIDLGALGRIDMPTGGYTSIGYQVNKYYDATTNEEKSGPGLRVVSITTMAKESASGVAHAITKNYQYTNTDGTTSGKLMYPATFAFTDGTNIYRTQDNLMGQELYYSRVKEITPGLGYKVYNYSIPNMYPQVSPVMPMSKVARQNGSTCSAGLLQNGIYTFPFAPAQDLDFKRGLLTKVSEFTDADVLTRERRMTYATQHTASTVKGLRLEPITSGTKTTYHYSVYQIPYGQSQLLMSDVTKTIGDESEADSIKVSTAYQYNTRDQITQVTTTNADNSIAKNFITYAGDYNITTPAANDVQANAIYKLNTTNRYGLPIESYTKFTPVGGTEIYTGASLTIFKDYGTPGVFPYQSKHFPQGLSFAPAYASTGATQSFVADNKYILDNTVEYASSLPVNQTGISLVPSGTHYATNSTLPLASFANCKAEHAVYEGFEMASSHGLTTSVNVTHPAGRTGSKCLQFDNTVVYIKSGNVTKNGNLYRISMWANAAQATTFTVKAMNGTTEQASLPLTLSTTNQWTYLEGVMNTTNVSSTFTLEIVTNLSGTNTAQIDDFVAMPKNARVSFQTYAPLTGVTSQTDDRGNSMVIAYDLMGRKVNTLDRQRNLVELREYALQQQGEVTVNPQFTSNRTKYIQGQAATFTAAPTCIAGATYDWTFTDITGAVSTVTGNNGIVTYTFNGFGPYTVKCTASAPGYTSQTFAQSICVWPSIQLQVSASRTRWYFCDPAEDVNVVTFDASILNFNMTGFIFDYQWYVTDINGNWVLASIQPNVQFSPDGSEFTYTSPAYSYQVKCNLSIRSTPLPGYSDCTFAIDNLGTVTSNMAGVTFVNDSPCR